MLGSEPVIEEWLDRRRALGQDRRDEVWDGVHHVVPPEHARSGALAMQLLLPAAPASAAGLVPGGAFNLGTGSNDFRVPDLGFHRRGAD